MSVSGIQTKIPSNWEMDSLLDTPTTYVKKKKGFVKFKHTSSAFVLLGNHNANIIVLYKVFPTPSF